MKLLDLIAPLKEIQVTGPKDVEIQSLAYDSRSVRPGALFVAVRGQHTDGHRYITSAQKDGASAVVVDREGVRVDGTYIRVSDSRRALAVLAAQWYGHPANQLKLVGITGTDGKTTTSFLMRGLLQAAGYRVGLIGTVANYSAGMAAPARYTTPEALELHQLLAQMVSEQNDFVVMEVSSHALALDRVFGIPFDVAVFTNLTRDHIDFHETFEKYRAAKALLFERLDKPGARAVINRDDPNAHFLEDRIKVPIITYSTEPGADISLVRLSLESNISRVEVDTPLGSIDFNLHLLGRFNARNALAAIATGIALQLPLDAIREGLETVRGVDGRFETVKTGKGFTVIIDYAHTPEALGLLLAAVREMARGRVLVIFGCGGDRDQGKRALMGQVASEQADLIILTTDNPRSEDPQEILQDIQQGVSPQAPCDVVVDRREAIRHGLSLARSEDILVISGRGHERFQIVQDQRVPFLDRTVVEEELASLNN